MTAEEERLAAAQAGEVVWRRWGPYLSERQWGTVREDYSAGGTPWEYFSHDQARFRAYRWGEDGLLGISDDQQHLCFALALWNGQDPFLKERTFGLTSNQGNHGEDVKEYFFYLDNVPSHAYMKALYKYPQRAYPYADLVEENGRRGQQNGEYELLDTGIFDDDRYFDVFVEYAKVTAEDILIQISVANRGPDTATCHLLPTLWFRNTWSWFPNSAKPALSLAAAGDDQLLIKADHPELGRRWLYCEGAAQPLTRALFTENETNFQRLFGTANASPYVKDGIHEAIVQGRSGAVNPAQTGTKVAAHYPLEVAPGQTAVVRLRLSDDGRLEEPFASFEEVVAQRVEEADDFYQHITPFPLPDDMRNVQRQAFAGLLWSKQFYYYWVQEWLKGDPAEPPPPPERRHGRNKDWWHLNAGDILSMPDKWEFPWFAAWDLAFHTIPLALIDPEFAKQQLILLLRAWYMHPNGQIPAYEWAFSDVNPPVHAWAALRVYQIEGKMTGRSDRKFLEHVFQKLLLNFTWWVNRKDAEGNNIFEGGFLGLDNIGVFDRNTSLPSGGLLEQADGTSWMAMYCLNMLAIALELAEEDPVYEFLATKFFEHFIYIADAMNELGEEESGLWDEADGYYYDVLKLPDGRAIRMRTQTIAGLVPLFAIATQRAHDPEDFPEFDRRMQWFLDNRPHLTGKIADLERPGIAARKLLAIVDPDKLKRILEKALDEDGMLSPYGIRSVSRLHARHPFIFEVDGQRFELAYEPADSQTDLFGGNSNWRGPVWFPLNFLLIESLQKFHYYLGDEFRVPWDFGPEKSLTLWQACSELSERLIKIFLRDENGRRPLYGDVDKFQNDPYWRDLILFYEYFHGDNGAGLGASHQTGWTGIVAKLIQQHGEYRLQDKTPLEDEG
jgi:hypothetical protein